MLTYQDLLAVGENEKSRADFIREIIGEHEGSALYQTAKIADDYDRCLNTTIMQYEQTITTVTGKTVRDPWSPNHKSATNFFHVFLLQLAPFLLGNGVTWKNEETKNKLGTDFDSNLLKMAKYALKGGVAFGFFNYDHLDVFPIYDLKEPCFAPIIDEESGGYRAGVRYWQVDNQRKSKRATLYEESGYTDYLWQNDPPLDKAWARVEQNVWIKPKRAYITTIQSTEADGVTQYLGENYPSFPIVPMWGNTLRQSEIVGMRAKLDAYDLILNGYENDLDNAQLYWIIKGAGGMDDADLATFLHRLKTVKAAAPGDDQDVNAVQVEIPYAAREALLERLEKQLYKDAMILNPQDIASGAATATQIKAAYEPQNVRTDDLEYCVLDFLDGILKVAGMTDEPTFSRSEIVNQEELIRTLTMAAEHVSQEYMTTKILTVLGDGDRAEDVLAQMQAEAMTRAGYGAEDGTDEPEGENAAE